MHPVRPGDTVCLPVQDPPAAVAAGVVQVCKVIEINRYDDGRTFVQLAGIAEPVPLEQVVISPGPLERHVDELIERIKAGDVGAPFEAEAVRMLRQLHQKLPADYERARQRLKECGARIAELEKLIGPARRSRNDADEDDRRQGCALTFDEDEPAAEPVDGAALLDEIESIVRRYVVLSDETAHAVALWIVASCAINGFRIFPRLLIGAATYRCGKSTLMEVIQNLVCRPVSSSSATPAAIFRIIDEVQPTLFLDEFDNAAKENPDLKAIVNSGHQRSTAQVIRTVGDDFEPRQFSTWSPMVIAGIGKPWNTLRDRSIEVPLKRKLKAETVARLRPELRDQFTGMRGRIVRWIGDNAAALRRDVIAHVPVGLHDRAGDNWEPLIAVAAAAGSEWLELAQTSALILSGGDLAAADDVGTEFLFDLRALFIAEDHDQLASKAIVEKFNDMPERRWPEFRGGKGFNSRSLAALAGRFKVVSMTVTPKEGGSAKGYKRADFEDAFARYLADLPP
ncbi:hypothetical protein CQ12_10755 [Bradyrhizobium jicamae]|uniref:DUF3631 domain-containing protein n=1 Tax=Bradyrhizobium jicamae TaxID=280332 RepID=A0A0R3M3I7_9BRAD|nr:DUF3631 domain-containing protein [Bradyrhizobium jicamae]KRR14602.1 hypothetical protein CQ12_10755 [Bradyrhizobium jicamae]